MSEFFTVLPERAILAIEGEDRHTFLNALITNDITPQGAAFACLLSPQGKYLFDFFVIDQPDALWLDVAAPRLEALLQRLNLYKLRARISLQPRPDLLVAASASTMPLHLKAAVSCFDPRLKDLGSRIICPRDWWPDAKAALLAYGLDEGTTGNYTRHQLLLGVPDLAADLVVDRSFPLEANIDALHGISFSKGCYVGQELMARMHHRALIRKRILLINSNKPLSPGTAVMSGTDEAGTICSSDGTTALALLRLEYAPRLLTVDGTIVKVIVPGWLERFVDKLG